MAKSLAGRLKSKISRLLYKSKDWDSFYHRFEECFRGSDQVIAERLALRYSQILKNHYQEKAQFLDLGCGKGEFLDLAKSMGYQTIGVDSSKVFARKNQGRGHAIFGMDILKALKKMPSASIKVCTLIHVVEHLDFRYTFEMVREVARVLTKDGLFIIETPSLFSLWVSARQFYLDPTHEKPVHPNYLSFLCQDSGFQKVEPHFFAPIEPHLSTNTRSSEESEKLEKTLLGWQDWLYGPMDFTLYAFKS